MPKYHIAGLAAEYGAQYEMLALRSQKYLLKDDRPAYINIRLPEGHLDRRGKDGI